MVIERTNKLLVVILVCFCLNLLALGQGSNPHEKTNHPIEVVKAPASESQSSEISIHSLLTFGQEEPIVLLLCGLLLFAAATTIRRKRSAGRKQTSRSLESSV